MKKGILAGISVVAISAAFWACGSGSVEDLNAGDENALGLYGFDPEAMVGKKAEALKACEDDAACVAKQTGAELIDVEDEDEDDEGDSEDESSESSEPVSSDSKAATSSSSTAVTSSAGGSTGGTSSATVTGNSSASVTGNSSAVITPVGKSSSSTATSSAAASGTVNGSCGPSTSTIEKGGSTTWKFTKTGSLTAQPTLDWTFDGGDKKNESGTASSVTTATSAITYSKAGSYGASVILNKGKDDEKTVTCSKVKVNGAAISGCKCTPNVTEADLADGEGSASVKWTVSGCANADGSTTFTYAWKDGSTSAGSSSSFTKKFTERTKSYAPTVTISNSDKMTMSPTCTAASVVDSKNPEYVLESVGEQKTFPSGACVSISGDAASAKNLRCSHSWQSTSCVFTMKSGETVVEGSKGNCNFSNETFVLSNMVNGLVCLSVDVEEKDGITCQAVNW